jgi:Zn-dependent membrane protease YugP
MISYWIIFGVFLLASWLVSARLKKRFKEYSEIALTQDLSGKDVAEKMLKNNGIFDVKVTCVEGELTDHYHPVHKTVNLSHDVYYGRNVAAAAVAAHECGHAIQHADAYVFLKMRSALVPVVSFASHWVQWVLLAGILLVSVFPALLLIGIVIFAFTTIFSIITLPVEIDASRRALVWLNTSGLTSTYSHSKAQNALKLAAYTYALAALQSLATLAYYVMIYLGRRD